jgi:hypothetical protein
MHRVLKAKVTPAVLAAIALAIVTTGAGLAASGGGGAITACVHHKGGALYRATRCPSHDTKLTWNKTGPAGPIGPRGPAGTKGNAGPQGRQGNPGSARGFAFVDANGTVKTKGGSIDIKIDKIKTGEYCLLLSPKPGFFAPIVATIQGPDLTPGLISVNTSFGSDCNSDGGYGVFTMNTAGTATDHQFVVAVM